MTQKTPGVCWSGTSGLGARATLGPRPRSIIVVEVFGSLKETLLWTRRCGFLSCCRASSHSCLGPEWVGHAEGILSVWALVSLMGAPLSLPTVATAVSEVL